MFENEAKNSIESPKYASTFSINRIATRMGIFFNHMISPVFKISIYINTLFTGMIL